MDAVAFYNVAEDLVEVNATQATQNLKIDATEHAIALDIAIGKTRLFHIAMNTKYSSHFTINYVLKKSYPVENENTSLILPTLENTKVAKVYKCLSLPYLLPTIYNLKITFFRNQPPNNLQQMKG